MRSAHSVAYLVLCAFLSNNKPAGCNPITNSNLNDHIRDFSSKDDNITSTRIKTLQKDESGRYANFAPVRNPVRFKDSSDNALSSSSYSRGLLQHDHPGYPIHEYEEGPPHGYAYEYHIPDTDHGYHSFGHHAPDYYPGHHGGHHHVNYHHKHYDHALAAKTILWPIAGIALLGAAAALVSNPVLLQLGVVSGKRKRRDTEENFEPELDAGLNWLKKNDQLVEDQPISLKATKRHSSKTSKQSDEMNFSYKSDSIRPYKKMHYVKQETLYTTVHPTVQSAIEDITVDTLRRNVGNEKNLIPVPLLIKENT